MTFSFGVHVGQQNASMDELRALWRRLDEAGVDWISAWDHLYEAPPSGGTIAHFEAVATLAAMACETERARLGVLVCCVPYRNPALLAKSAVAIDHLSGGRFELGLGAGWHEPEFRAHGYDFAPLGTRFDMLGEGIEIIRSMFTEERTTFTGEHYQVDDVSTVPGPVRGHLPLWIGGVGEKRTLRLAAKYMDGWNAAYISSEEFGRLCGVLDQRCAEVGRDPSSIERTINLSFNLGTTVAATEQVEERMRQQFGPGDTLDRIISGALMGTPDQAMDRLAAYRQAGANGINVALRLPVDDKALDAYLHEVIPAARQEFAAEAG